jgi:hypothetical protein
MRLFFVSVPVKSVRVRCSAALALQKRVVSDVFEPEAMTMPRPLRWLSTAPSMKSVRSLIVISTEPRLSRICV